MTTTTVSLTALSGTPLDEPTVKGTVATAAHALAERTGLKLTDLTMTDTTLTVTLGCARLEAIGFMAQLRHDTNAWYEGKYRDGPLWGTARNPEL